MKVAYLTAGEADIGQSNILITLPDGFNLPSG
jgi:hypothetical protein